MVKIARLIKIITTTWNGLETGKGFVYETYLVGNSHRPLDLDLKQAEDLFIKHTLTSRPGPAL